jgi:hypothetical protein
MSENVDHCAFVRAFPGGRLYKSDMNNQGSSAVNIPQLKQWDSQNWSSLPLTIQIVGGSMAGLMGPNKWRQKRGLCRRDEEEDGLARKHTGWKVTLPNHPHSKNMDE